MAPKFPPVPLSKTGLGWLPHDIFGSARVAGSGRSDKLAGHPWTANLAICASASL